MSELGLLLHNVIVVCWIIEWSRLLERYEESGMVYRAEIFHYYCTYQLGSQGEDWESRLCYTCDYNYLTIGMSL